LSSCTRRELSCTLLPLAFDDFISPRASGVRCRIPCDVCHLLIADLTKSNWTRETWPRCHEELSAETCDAACAAELRWSRRSTLCMCLNELCPPLPISGTMQFFPFTYRFLQFIPIPTKNERNKHGKIYDLRTRQERNVSGKRCLSIERSQVYNVENLRCQDAFSWPALPCHLLRSVFKRANIRQNGWSWNRSGSLCARGALWTSERDTFTNADRLIWLLSTLPAHPPRVSIIRSYRTYNKRLRKRICTFASFARTHAWLAWPQQRESENSFALSRIQQYTWIETYYPRVKIEIRETAELYVVLCSFTAAAGEHFLRSARMRAALRDNGELINWRVS